MDDESPIRYMDYSNWCDYSRVEEYDDYDPYHPDTPGEDATLPVLFSEQDAGYDYQDTNNISNKCMTTFLPLAWKA